MLKILALVLALSIVAGVATRGKLARLANLRFRAIPLLYASLILGLVPLFANMGAWESRVLVTAAYLMLVVFLLLNIPPTRGNVRLGIGVLCLGWLLNAVPFAANGGMPLSLVAYNRAGIRGTPTPAKGGFFKIVIANDKTRVRFLGDVIPLRPIGQVVSIGDISLALGIGTVIVAAMHDTGAIVS